MLALVLSMPALAHAQSDGRFSGTVLDPSGAVVAERDRGGQERAHRRGAHGDDRRRRAATS